MKRAILMGLGLVCCLLGIIWLRCNLAESNRAAMASITVLPQLEQYIPISDSFMEMPTQPLQEAQVVTEIEIDGRPYIAVLEIPALELTLPVIGSWSEENGKIAPCRYSGSFLNNNLVICAHNYKSHFGNLPVLELGDSVVLTDMDGNVYSYQVSEKLVISGMDLAELEAGEWDLTMFTCTNGGKSRFLVRCNLQK